MRFINIIGLLFLGALANSANAELLQSNIVSYDDADFARIAGTEIVLQNDSFIDGGGQAYLQMGFVKGEKAGVFLKVPESVKFFRVKTFRILMGSENMPVANNASYVAADSSPVAVYFNMAVLNSSYAAPLIPDHIVNAAQVMPGPYWNDIPAEGADSKLECAHGGDIIGAAVEFTHSGTPSIYRDIDGLKDMSKNVIMAVPGGWNYSSLFGVRGDWVLRVVGEEVTASDCK